MVRGMTFVTFFSVFLFINGMECVQRMMIVDDEYEEARLSRARALSLDDEADGRRLIVVVVVVVMIVLSE